MTDHVRINPQPIDPVGYWTPLYVVAVENEDNVATFRNQTSDVQGQGALRFQDYLGNERGAMGYGNLRGNDLFNRAMFVEIGNIVGGTTNGTSFKVVNTHIGTPPFPDGAYIQMLAAEDGRFVYRRGATGNHPAFYIDTEGRVGVGLGFDTGAPLAASFQVNGYAYVDPDGLGAAGPANSAAFVVVRSSSASWVASRVVRDGVGSIAAGYATSGVIGVDVGDIQFKTGLTGADLTTGTTRLTVKASGQARLAPLSAAPANAEEGDIYFNGTTKKFNGYDGTNWNAL